MAEKMKEKQTLQAQAWELAETGSTIERIAEKLNRKTGNIQGALRNEKNKRGLTEYPFKILWNNYIGK